MDLIIRTEDGREADVVIGLEDYFSDLPHFDAMVAKQVRLTVAHLGRRALEEATERATTTTKRHARGKAARATDPSGHTDEPCALCEGTTTDQEAATKAAEYRVARTHTVQDNDQPYHKLATPRLVTYQCADRECPLNHEWSVYLMLPSGRMRLCEWVADFGTEAEATAMVAAMTKEAK